MISRIYVCLLSVSLSSSLSRFRWTAGDGKCSRAASTSQTTIPGGGNFGKQTKVSNLHPQETPPILILLPSTILFHLSRTLGNQKNIKLSDRNLIHRTALLMHITFYSPFYRYFVSHILQFQFYESMCIAAGEFDPNSNTSKPLYQCDFAGSKAAGKLLG
jgi:hypothetical protein